MCLTKTAGEYRRSLRRRLSGERGVFIPLMSVLLLGLIYVAIALGFDASMVKRAQMDIRAKLDLLCADLSRTPRDYVENARTFRNYVNKMVNQNHVKLTRLESAYLIMPTMAPSHPFYNTVAAPAPFIPGALDFQSPALGIGGPACDLTGDPDCKFYGAIPAGYPATVWNNLQGAGNGVGCEIRGRVRTLLLGRVPWFDTGNANLVTVRSVFWSPVHGPYLYIPGTAPPEYYDSTDASTAVRTAPGLTIGIGTEMFTSVWDGRFRFSQPPALPLTDSFDPITRSINPNFEAFMQDQPQDTSAVGGTLEFVQKIDRNRYMGVIPRNPPYGTSSTDRFPASFTVDDPSDFDNGAQIPSDRESMLVACLNPLTMARNLYLSTIVEQAARHGQLRNMTEILHVNPIHRDLNFFPSGVEDNGTISNPPTYITGFGDDIAQRAFTIPYVFYHTGMVNKTAATWVTTERPSPTALQAAGAVTDYEWTRPPSGFPAGIAGGTDTPFYAKNGWLNPYADATAAGTVDGDPAWRSHHALIAGQLRYCYSLYGGSDYIDRYRPDFFDKLFSSGTFEPALMRLPPQPQGLRSPAYEFRGAPPYAFWDRTDPATGHSAAEVVSMLGTTQMCPYTENNLGLWPAARNSTDTATFNREIAARFGGANVAPCPPTTLYKYAPYSGEGVGTIDTLELRPDVLGFFRYVQGGRSKSVMEGSTANIVQGLASPGIFPVPATLDPRIPLQSSTINPYRPVANEMSHIFLLIHQPPTDTEKAAIRAEIDHMRAANPAMVRPITVIYMPTTEEDADKILDIYEMVGASTAEPGSAAHNAAAAVVYHLSPFDDTFGPQCDPAPARAVSMPEWQKFRDYWECLLTEGTGNVVALAKTHFHNRMTRNEMKF